jgi:hypothetical protein
MEKQDGGYVAVRGAGKICGFPPTDRCCCFELRTGLIILPCLLLLDLLIVDVLFWLEHEKNMKNAQEEEAEALQTVAELKAIGTIHFLVFAIFMAFGISGAVLYKAHLVKPMFLFAPMSAGLCIVYALAEISLTTGLTLVERYWALMAGVWSAAIDLWYGYAMWSLYWQLKAGIIRKPEPNGSQRASLSTTTRYYQKNVQEYGRLNTAADEEQSSVQPHDPRFPQQPAAAAAAAAAGRLDNV